MVFAVNQNNQTPDPDSLYTDMSSSFAKTLD